MENKILKCDSFLTAFTFTINNYDARRENVLQEFLSGATYAVYGREIAPTTGTRHLQGYCRLGTRKRFSTIKKLLGDAHVERAKGNDKQNEVYCKKSNDFWEKGTPRDTHTGSSLSRAIEVLKENNGNIRELAMAEPEAFVRYHSGLRVYSQLCFTGTQRNWYTMAYVFIGAPGVGKSYRATSIATKFGSVYYKGRSKWWDNYSGQETVIVDDYYGFFPYDELLRLLDRYPHRIQLKGSSTEFISKKIIFTSNKTIEEWYDYDYHNKEALIRRLHCYELMIKKDNCIELKNLL